MNRHCPRRSLTIRQEKRDFAGQLLQALSVLSEAVLLDFDVTRLARYRENNRLEFKRAKGGLPRSFWETYSAFANTDGGVIVLGADEGTDGFPVPTGITDLDGLIKDLWNGLNNPERASANILVDSDVEVAHYEGHDFIVVRVPRADRHLRPVFVNNNPKTGTYRRNGEGDYHVTNEVYLSLVRDSLIDPIDRVLLEEFSLDDLYAETIDAYRNSFKSMRPNHPWVDLDDTSFLTRIGAAGRSEHDHLIHPTRAGLLMFGEAWRIVDEFPQYFLDCRQVLNDGNRWNNRIVSSSGEWSGNVFDFWHRAYRMLSDGLPVPFRLAPDMHRIDTTPQHRAVREALTNALVHADYFGRTGVVVIREPDKVITRNPGTLRIGLDEVEAGGISDPRNETLLFMFSLVNIGERAGSGFDILRKGTSSAGKPDPVLEEFWEPDRVRLTLPLETSGLAEFDLPGMEGNTDQVTDQVGGNTDQVTDQVGGNTDQVTDQVSGGKQKTMSPVQELLAVLGNQEMSATELMQKLGLKHRPSFRERYLDPALERGLIERTIPDKPTSSKQKYRRTGLRH